MTKQSEETSTAEDDKISPKEEPEIVVPEVITTDDEYVANGPVEEEKPEDYVANTGDILLWNKRLKVITDTMDIDMTVDIVKENYDRPDIVEFIVAHDKRHWRRLLMHFIKVDISGGHQSTMTEGHP